MDDLYQTDLERRLYVPDPGDWTWRSTVKVLATLVGYVLGVTAIRWLFGR